MLTHRIALLICVTGWAGAAAMAQTQTTSVARTSYFPPFGLGSTETARINLTNIATSSSGGTAASCTGTVSFVNSSGATIGTATPFTVPSGQTSSVSLAFNNSGLTGPRGVLRAVVQVTRPTATSAPPCALLTSLEAFDTSSGATHVFMQGSEIDVAGHR